MSYQRDREQFLLDAARWGIDATTARLLMRDAATLHRWAEEECNGTIQRDESDEDKPYRHWRMEDPNAPGGGYRSKAPIRDAEKYAQDRIRKRLAPLGLQPWFQGDPRGYVVRIARADATHDDMYCGRASMLGVPTR